MMPRVRPRVRKHRLPLRLYDPRRFGGKEITLQPMSTVRKKRNLNIFADSAGIIQKTGREMEGEKSASLNSEVLKWEKFTISASDSKTIGKRCPRLRSLHFT